MRVALCDFANCARPRPPQALLYSVGLEFVAWLILFDVLLRIGVDIAKVSRLEIGRLSSTIFLAILFVVIKRIAKKYRLNTERILRTDSRKPIIYLRSFAEEFEPGTIFFDKARSDETLTSVLKKVGPVVAVGRPADKVEPLGAARIYFDDLTWQEHVTILMRMSKLVVIQAGISPGLTWEITTAKKWLEPQQILFSFLSWQELDPASRETKYSQFAANLKSNLELNLPERIDSAYFLHFDHEWNACLATLHGWKKHFFRVTFILTSLWMAEVFPQGTFHNAKRLVDVSGVFRRTSVPSVREALRPVLKSQGIGLPVLNTMTFIGLVLLYLLLPLILFLLVLLGNILGT